MGAVALPEVAERETGKEERILVSVRIRPLNAKEIETNDASDWECIDASTVVFKSSLSERALLPTAYSFDRVFASGCTTRQVYEEGAKEVALSVVGGINSSIFAYGQTSSGKTYTMTGITKHSIADIYRYIQQHDEREFVLKFSALEIYNEAVRDLLSADSSPLRLLDDPEKGTVVEKLTEETLNDQNHFMDLFSICEAQRQTGETYLNEMSSRSHQILRLTVESSARDYLTRESSSTVVASVNFIDLAGSERASQSLSAGLRLKEGSHINRSLLTLGTVIRKLSKGRNEHIPYRDSKLTRILQNSLGGNARTAIICTMSPAHSHVEQSRNTLMFASCAKEVVTNARVNLVMSDKALVKHLQKELARLENELKSPASASCTNHDAALREKNALIRKLEKEVEDLMQQRNLVQSRLDDLLKSVGDDHTSGTRGNANRSSVSHAHNASQDTTSSTSDLHNFAYEDPGFGSDFDTPCTSNNYSGHLIESPNRTTEVNDSSPRNSTIGSFGFAGAGSNRSELVVQSTPKYDDHCKEVKCIEIIKEGGKIDELICPPFEEPCNLLPFTDRNKAEEMEQQLQPDDHPESKEQSEDIFRLRHHENASLDFDFSKPCSDEALFFRGKDSEDLKLTRSSSCRGSLMRTNWYNDTDSYHKTPPNDYLKSCQESLQEVTNPQTEVNNHQTESFPVDESNAFTVFSCDQVIKVHDVATREDVPTIDDFHPETEEKLIQNLNWNHESPEIASVDVVEAAMEDVDSTSRTVESLSKWTLEFEKKQHEIIELWHACNISIIHRTYFFILFKGDPADSIYMEVEHRRLSFLRKSCGSNIPKAASDDESSNAIGTSIKTLQREREMLYKQMLKKLPLQEREKLYAEWGIALNSKQRRLQLSRQMWTQTNIDHVQRSASLVATLIELFEPSKAPKEMFGLSFACTSPLLERRSFSWFQGNYSLK